jgi:hypothetical protein
MPWCVRTRFLNACQEVSPVFQHHDRHLAGHQQATKTRVKRQQHLHTHMNTQTD